MPISSSKFALLILMIAAICIIVSSATPAETCLRRLTKFCKNVVNPEDCKMTTAVQTFRALADCCSGQCTKQEIVEACCF